MAVIQLGVPQKNPRALPGRAPAAARDRTEGGGRDGGGWRSARAAWEGSHARAFTRSILNRSELYDSYTRTD
jgi:hypothetical protein